VSAHFLLVVVPVLVLAPAASSWPLVALPAFAVGSWAWVDQAVSAGQAEAVLADSPLAGVHYSVLAGSAVVEHSVLLVVAGPAGPKSEVADSVVAEVPG
jgi:hypothetical protein